MRQTWRWFGPQDKVSLDDARQAGVEGIVTALHHVPTGDVWRPEEIEKRQREVAFTPGGTMTHLAWEVVESLPVSEAIKTQSGDWRAHIVHYRRSLENLAQAGIRTICYNFMPVLDWTRTDLAWRVAHGGTAMRFDLADFPLLGQPRVMSSEADYRHMLNAVDLPANGATFCTGSLGARPDNDLPAMARALGPRIHFVHLRNVRRDTEETPCSFFEDEHLNGNTDMVAVVAALLAEERRRVAEGRSDTEIPMRPDHGQDILDDLRRGAQPGYPAIGRLKGLAELRGVMAALNHPAVVR